MPWGRVDDTHYDHDKVLEIASEIRNESIGLYWRSISYSNAKLTDGVISASIVEHLNGRPEIVDALCRVKLWHRRQGGRSFVIHDFSDFNWTRAEAEAHHERKAEAGRLGGLRSGEARRKQRGTNGKAGASPVLELPTRTESTTESPTPNPRPPGRGRSKRAKGDPTDPRYAQYDARAQRDSDDEAIDWLAESGAKR